MCVTCSRNVLHEVKVQLCSHYHVSWEGLWCVPLLLLSVEMDGDASDPL